MSQLPGTIFPRRTQLTTRWSAFLSPPDKADGPQEFTTSLPQTSNLSRAFQPGSGSCGKSRVVPLRRGVVDSLASPDLSPRNEAPWVWGSNFKPSRPHDPSQPAAKKNAKYKFGNVRGVEAGRAKGARVTGRLLRARDVADRLGISVDTVLRWSRSGKLPAGFRLATGTLRWSEDELDRWLEACREESCPLLAPSRRRNVPATGAGAPARYRQDAPATEEASDAR
jgi:excisionase family DNA binding protein